VKYTDLLLHYTGSTWELFAPGKLLTLSASDKLIGRATSGAGVAEEITCTAAGRALLHDADAAAQLATLGTWRVLAASAVAASVTGTTTETALAATITLLGRSDGDKRHPAGNVDLQLHEQRQQQEHPHAARRQRPLRHAAAERHRLVNFWNHAPACDAEPQRAELAGPGRECDQHVLRNVRRGPDHIGSRHIERSSQLY